MVVHPEYDCLSRANDLAHIELEVTSMQYPIPIFNSPRFPSSSTTFGYDVKDPDLIDGEHVSSDELRFTSIDTISKNSQCMQLLQQLIDASMLCAGDQISKDACVRDSGGPLVAESVVISDFVALVGVISYGRGDCGSAFPGVYTNVTTARVVHSTPPELISTPLFSMVPVGNSNSSTASSSTSNSTSPAKYYAPIVDNKYEVPADLSPGVKDSLIGFLIGDMGQIDSSHLSDLLNESELVFTSIQSLEGVKEIVTKHDQKPLHQRETRFSEQSSSSSQCQP